MKRELSILVLSFCCLSLFQAKAFPAVNNIGVLPRAAVVCFVDFRVGLVIGKSETSIGNKKYCKYEIDRERFISLLTVVPSSTFYMKDNVRAEVSFSEIDKYFIDYNGVVRFGEKKFQIDKKMFTDSLKVISGR